MTAATQSGSEGASRSRRLFLTVSSALAVVALLVEPLARRTLFGGSTVDLGPLQLRLAYNTGVAFSLGDQLPTWVVLSVTAAITAGIGVYAWRSAPTSSTAAAVGFAAIFAGAAANVIDRAADGKVTDYFHTGWWPTFNLADTYLTCGVLLVAAALLREPTPASAKESLA